MTNVASGLLEPELSAELLGSNRLTVTGVAYLLRKLSQMPDRPYNFSEGWNGDVNLEVFDVILKAVRSIYE